MISLISGSESVNMAETAVAVSGIPETLTSKAVVELFTQGAGNLRHSVFLHETSGLQALLVFQNASAVTRALHMDGHEVQGAKLKVNLLNTAQIHQLEVMLDPEGQETEEEETARRKSDHIFHLIQGLDAKTQQRTLQRLSLGKNAIDNA